jgi:hypothetical protein
MDEAIAGGGGRLAIGGEADDWTKMRERGKGREMDDEIFRMGGSKPSRTRTRHRVFRNKG